MTKIIAKISTPLKGFSILVFLCDWCGAQKVSRISLFKKKKNHFCSRKCYSLFIKRESHKTMEILRKIKQWNYIFKGRECIVLSRGKMNSILIEFCDNNQREIVSRNSLKRNKE